MNRTDQTASQPRPVLDRIVSVIQDRRSGRVRIQYVDGRVVDNKIADLQMSPGSTIRCIELRPRQNRLTLHTVHGSSIVVELPEDGCYAPLNGRPVIYLDQKDWASLSNALHAPSLLTKVRRDAALEMIALARERRIVLPLSSMHLSETCKWTNDNRRLRQSTLMAQLSGGWQLLDPLAVRLLEIRREMSRIYAHTQTVDRPVITLEPDAVFAERSAEKPVVELHWALEVPAEMQLIIRAATTATGTIDALLDSESVPMDPAPKWTEVCLQLSKHLAESGLNKSEKRAQTFGFFQIDISKEAMAAAIETGTTSQEFDDFLRVQLKASLRNMPALSFFYEVLHQKLASGTRKWSSNDLTDMMSLATASGYADAVICESAMAGQLQTCAKANSREVQIFRNIETAMPVVRELAGRG